MQSGIVVAVVLVVESWSGGKAKSWTTRTTTSTSDRPEDLPGIGARLVATLT